MSVNTAVIAASAPGRSAVGTRSVRIVWMRGLTIPFAIPDATSAAEYTAAREVDASSQSGSAWPITPAAITEMPRARSARKR